MRCDTPRGYDDDYLEPPTDLYFQLFLQNLEDIPVVGVINENNEGAENLDGGVDDDNASFLSVSVHTMSDDNAPISPAESYPDIDPEAFDFLDESSNIGSSYGFPFNGFSGNDEESSSSECNYPGACHLDDQSSNVLSDTESNRSSLTDNDQNSENCIGDISDMVFPDTDLSSSGDAFSDSVDTIIGIYNALNQCASDPSDPHSISTPNPEIIANLLDAALQGTNDHEDISLQEIEEANEASISEEAAVIRDILSNNNTASLPSTSISLFGEMSPLSCSDEETNSMSEVSSDKQLSDEMQINALPSSLLLPDVENISSDDESLHIINKMFDNSEELAPDSPAVCSSSSVEEDNIKPSLTDLDSSSDSENSVSSDNKTENAVGFDENFSPESGTFNTDFSDEINAQQEGNTSCGVTSEKSVPNLKRKVANSGDDTMINKVPKYSVSHESHEVMNETSVDNYSKELSSDNEMPILRDEDNIDIVPSTLAVKNATLSVGGSREWGTVEESSVTEQQSNS